MEKSELFSSLADINFAEKDPGIIESEILTLYENFSGRTLSRADPVRIFLNAIILVIIQQRNLIDIAAKNNLLAYAQGGYLDHIGALLGVRRLSASHASCEIRFTLSSPQNFDIVIPANTKITADREIFFATVESVTIPAGETFTDCEAICQEPGILGNDFALGQINKLVDIFPYEMRAENISVSTGGTDSENDENFRERIMLAPESFTTAGSVNAYKFFAKSAHPDILDAAILTPAPGVVEIVPLCYGGIIPSPEILAAVLESCNAENIRPDTDYVKVSPPKEIDYNLNVKIFIDEKNSSSRAALEAAINAGVENWKLWQRSELGRDLNPSELNRVILNAGAKRSEILEPAFKILQKNEIGRCRNSQIVFALEEG